MTARAENSKMSTENFLKSIRALAEAPMAPPIVRSPSVTGIGLAADAAEYETKVGDPVATARMIIAAAAARDGGGPMMPKPSTVAQQILDAGAKRRGG
jgi:hypothetical protein